MSLDKLGKKLSKEFQRSPQKVIALGLLIPVALYFWAPLVMKWTKRPSPPAAATQTPAITPTAVASAANAGAAPTAGTESSATASWETLERWRSEDLLTKPAESHKSERDPFRFITAEPTEVVTENETPEPEVVVEKKPQIDPSKLKLDLQATLVGGRARRATINGRIFREGQAFYLDGTPLKPNDILEAGKTLQIVSIQATSVTLVSGDFRFDLPIKPMPGLGSDSFARPTKTDE